MGRPQTLSVVPSGAASRPPAMRPSIDPGCRCSSQVKTEKSRAGSNATRLTWRPSTSEGTMRCGATRATPGVAAIRSARSAGRVSSVGCTVSRLEVMFTRVVRGTMTRSAPMREKLVAIPSCSAQPAMKLAKPMPTPSITASPRNIARSRRRPTFCAANRISSKRSCQRRTVSLPRSVRSQQQLEAAWRLVAASPVTSIYSALREERPWLRRFYLEVMRAAELGSTFASRRRCASMIQSPNLIADATAKAQPWRRPGLSYP